MHGNAKVAYFGDGWFEEAGAVDGAGVDGDEAETAAQVEAQGIEVVVGGHEPDAATARGAGCSGDGFHQGGADARPGAAARRG